MYFSAFFLGRQRKFNFDVRIDGENIAIINCNRRRNFCQKKFQISFSASEQMHEDDLFKRVRFTDWNFFVFNKHAFFILELIHLEIFLNVSCSRRFGRTKLQTLQFESKLNSALKKNPFGLSLDKALNINPLNECRYKLFSILTLAVATGIYFNRTEHGWANCGPPNPQANNEKL